MLKRGDEVMRRSRSVSVGFGDDIGGASIAAVQLAIGFSIRAQRRALERSAGENSPCAGVAQNLRAHVGVRVGCGRTSLRSSGGGQICAELYLAMQKAAGAAVVHDEKDKVSGFATDL